MTRMPKKPESGAYLPSDRTAVFPTPEGPPLSKQVTLQAAKWLVML